MPLVPIVCDFTLLIKYLLRIEHQD
jgi:hypothetical protein